MNTQVIIVTGSSTGFGRLTAETLARQGHTVFAAMRDLNGRNKEHVDAFQNLSKRDGLKIQALELDVSNDASVKAAVENVLKKAGRIDVLVNNVGQGSWGIAEGFTLEQVREQFEVNFFGAARMNLAVLPQMRKQGSGLLVHVSTLVGRLVIPFMVTYAVAKHALEALAEGYRYELAPLGVDSVIVEPQSYPTQGSMNKMAFPADQERVKAYGQLAERGQAMFQYNDQSLRSGEAGNPQDVADAVALLVNTPAGQRPLRTTVGGPMTQLVEPINATTEQAQSNLFDFMQLGDLKKIQVNTVEQTKV